ncbi:MAG: hypothetical protein KY476_18950 [Planctomycetes bacterium]|nr:hypothetical protein [Planctomycetota bacterium]
MRRLMMANLTILLLSTAVFAADDADKPAKPQGKTYEIDISDRRVKVGDRFLLAGKSTKTETEPQGSVRTHIELKAEYEVLDVNDDGEPVKARANIRSLRFTHEPADDDESKETAADPSQPLKKGDVLIVEAKDGEEVLLRESGEGDIPQHLQEAILNVIPIEDGDDDGPSLIASSEKPRRIGETWKLDKEQLPDPFRKAKTVEGSVELVGREKLFGSECLEIKLTLNVNGFTLDGPLGSGSTHGRVTWWLPVEGDRPPLKKSSTHTIEFEALGMTNKTTETATVTYKPLEAE